MKKKDFIEGYIVTSENGDEFLADRNFDTFIYMGYNRSPFSSLEGEIRRMKIPDSFGSMTLKRVCIIANQQCSNPVVKSDLKWDGDFLVAVQTFG